MEPSTSGNGMLDYTSLQEFSNRVEIYAGRHSRVWTSICTKTKKSVIVKGYIKDKMVARHFTQVSREIEIMKKINNQGVVMILGTFQDARCIYIVQEHCSRGDLFNRLMDRGGTLGEAEVAAKVCTPMLISLAKCHALNIIHRDIKPENIFIDREDRIRLGDFGLAIDKLKERPVSRIGTLDYMAPEVIAMPAEQDAAKGPVKSYDDRVDVWAVGILAYECIAGRPPFEVEDERQTTFLIVTAQISSFPPQFSSLAIDFIQLSLRKDPRQRPSASKLLQHPWIFPHYKRYVEETGDDLIGLFGPSTLPTAGPAAASPPPAAAAAAVAAPTSSTPVQTINRVTGGTSTTKPSTNGGGGMGGTPLRSPGDVTISAPKTPKPLLPQPSASAAQVSSLSKGHSDLDHGGGHGAAPAKNGVRPSLASSGMGPKAPAASGTGQSFSARPGGTVTPSGPSQTSKPLFGKSTKVLPHSSDSMSDLQRGMPGKPRFSVAGMFSKLLTTDKKAVAGGR